MGYGVGWTRLEKHSGIHGEKKKNFFSSSSHTYTGQVLFTRKSLPTQTRAYLSREEEEIFYFSSLENLCPPRHEPLHQKKNKKEEEEFYFFFFTYLDWAGITL